MSFAADPRSRPARGTGSVLVTGATGFLGRRVCRRLADRKEKFRALVRTSSNRSTLAGTGAWMVEGDLTRPESMQQGLEGAEVVLHLAGLVRSSDEAANRAVHVQGTANLLAACTAAGVRRVVAISSDTVLRHHRDAYARSKADAEALLAAWPGEVVVLRPPMMLGEGSPHLAQLRRMSRLPAVPVPPGSGARRPVRVEDVADAVLTAWELASGRLPAAPIDLPGPRRYGFGELIAAVARADGRRAPRVVEPPPSLARLGARLLGRTDRLAGLAEEPDVDDRVARDLLKWSPGVLFAASLG